MYPSPRGWRTSFVSIRYVEVLLGGCCLTGQREQGQGQGDDPAARQPGICCLCQCASPWRGDAALRSNVLMRGPFAKLARGTGEAGLTAKYQRQVACVRSEWIPTSRRLRQESMAGRPLAVVLTRRRMGACKICHSRDGLSRFGLCVRWWRRCARQSREMDNTTVLLVSEKYQAMKQELGRGIYLLVIENLPTFSQEYQTSVSGFTPGF